MDDCCCYADTTVTTRGEPNYSEAARRVLAEAREAVEEALLDLAAGDVSRWSPDPRQRPEYWVGHLQYLLGYLLIALEQADLSK